MKPAMWSVTIAASLVAVAFLGIALGTDAFEDAQPLAAADAHQHDEGPYGLYMHRPDFEAASPGAPASPDGLVEVHHLYIEAGEIDGDGVMPAGAGTLDDPYVLSGLYVVSDLYIKDTDACYIIRDNYIAGQLSLNWNGQCVHVHNNHIFDLRVNENIRRTGEATGGLIEQNVIGYVGQIRHYDGEFRYNTVGPMPERDGFFDPVFETMPFFDEDTRVLNVDGFNQAWFHDNVIQGSVDLDLHGHHHGSSFDADHSHNHGEGMDMGHDHTERYHSLFFTDNQVIDPMGYGVRYDDRNHAGDDRTAQSEQEEDLEMPHRHYTEIVIERNVIEGPLWVDVFNADDRLHEERNPGTFTIRDNTVIVAQREKDEGLLFFQWGQQVPTDSGITVYGAKEVEMEISGNTIQYTPLPDDGGSAPTDGLPALWWEGEARPTAAIRLAYFRDAGITVSGNVASGPAVGVGAYEFDELVSWSVLDNDFGDAEPIHRDGSVAQEPRTA